MKLSDSTRPVDTGTRRKFEAINRRTGANQLDASAYEYGKIPPQAREFEEAVLGAIMIEAEAINDVVAFLSADMFYVDQHRRIYAAIYALHKLGSPIDVLTVAEQLKTTGDLEAAGGSYYIAQLTNRIGSSANLEYHARVIQQKAIMRYSIAGCTEIAQYAYEDGAGMDEIIDMTHRHYDDLLAGLHSGSERPLIDIMQDTIVAIHSEAAHAGLSSNPFYLIDLDVRTDIKKGDLVIIAARPGMGKTAFVIHRALKRAKHGARVGFISLEMNSISLAKRLISQDGKIDLKEFKRQKGTNKEVSARITHTGYAIAALPLYLCEDTGISLSGIGSLAKKWKKKYDIDELIVDYLQLVRVEMSRNMNREQAVAQISRELKTLAMKLDIPVIALSQMSRPERGAVKKPNLTDLRESGAIEQDADAVIFLHRPEYYGLTTTEHGTDATGLCEVITAKQREGELSTVETRFEARYQCFFDWDGGGGDNREYDIKKKQELERKSNFITMQQAQERDADLPF